MSILARFTHARFDETVEILDAFKINGQAYASVRAIHGKPFADGARTTTPTAYKTVSADDLQLVCNCVLPEQSCPACRQAAAANLAADEIPF